jgi:hypothetical protein
MLIEQKLQTPAWPQGITTQSGSREQQTTHA